jgi:hypothetical protein
MGDVRNARIPIKQRLDESLPLVLAENVVFELV